MASVQWGRRGSFPLSASGRCLLMVLCLLGLLCAGQALAASDPQDSAGSSDPPLFTRMPGFHIYNSEIKDFDRYEFAVSPDKKEAVEGQCFKTIYYANEGIKMPSGLQIARNYINAATAIGGQKIFEFEDGGTQYVILKVVRQGSEFWTEVQAGGNGMYNVYMVEKKAMTQQVETTAEVMAGSIKESGKAAIYGIYFDTGKAVIKPESKKALTEIAKLIKAHPQMKFYVVGHTDNAGAFDYNLSLSNQRAAAVVKALVTQYGISQAVLRAHGVGPTAPVASNGSEAGRAKNRRVELVAQ